ncbi:hypothetical protein BABA_23970 [Neobacillus bataviensis LMG 21833]|uniref:Uncharacterized protein n=1 Tax=Neobacillus bataviensis LMG 21833 TaxID=1117379 RepID=K6D7P6_9BACI|nr:hypothetical protein BABA_23970 [Neobacillus bataviensis LMG 21833]
MLFNLLDGLVCDLEGLGAGAGHFSKSKKLRYDFQNWIDYSKMTVVKEQFFKRGNDSCPLN